jgi:hypothetical protein
VARLGGRLRPLQLYQLRTPPSPPVRLVCIRPHLRRTPNRCGLAGHTLLRTYCQLIARITVKYGDKTASKLQYLLAKRLEAASGSVPPTVGILCTSLATGFRDITCITVHPYRPASGIRRRPLSIFIRWTIPCAFALAHISPCSPWKTGLRSVCVAYSDRLHLYQWPQYGHWPTCSCDALLLNGFPKEANVASAVPCHSLI